MARSSLIREQKLTETELCTKSATDYTVNGAINENVAGERRSVGLS